MSRRELFRLEALEFHRSNDQWGSVARLQPFSTKLIAWHLIFITAALFTYLCIAQYARKETVLGYLMPSKGTAKIFAPQPGTIQTVLVKDGDEVTEGQPLLQITTAQVATNGQDINASIVNTLEHQKALLERQLDAQTHREQSERNRLNSLIQGTDAEIQSLTAQRETQKKRIELSETFVSSGAQLSARGYLADQELKKRQQAALEQKQVLESLDQQLASRRNQLTDSRYALEQLPVVIAEKLQILNNDLSSVQQRLAEANGRQAYVIRSPASGTVSTLQATPGQFADARRLQMEIVPSDTRLEAALFFPTRAFGFVHLGQEVRILYDAFPYQKFGTYRGHVINVSQTILTGSDAYGPITLKEPSYRVTAELERSEVDAYGRPIKLQPDMLLKADVILERRPLIRWLLDPILSARM